MTDQRKEPLKESAMSFEDVAPKVKGHLKILVHRVEDDGSKTLVKTVKVDNLIVNNFVEQELTALGLAANQAWRVVDNVRFGTDGTAAAVTDTAVTDPAGGPVAATVSSYTYPAYNQVQFEAILGSADGNGDTYHEVGLFFFNAGLAARTVIPAMLKSAMFTWTIQWTVEV